MKTILINKIFFLAVLFTILGFFGFIDSAQAATSVTKDSITWTFDDEYTVGTFINGDPYVVDSGSGVTVNSISPAYSAGRNGTVLNPATNDNHAFDSRDDTYDVAKQVSLPISLSSGDSLLSSISRDGIEDDWKGYSITSTSRYVIRTIAILTIVPPGDWSTYFRPAYTDRTQTMYNGSSLSTSWLPTLSTEGITWTSHEGFTGLEYYERGTVRPWILYGFNYQGREYHPILNMNGYHREVGTFLSEACVALISDASDKDQLLKNLVQIGIDEYYVGVGGEGDSSFFAIPILIAGKALNNPTLLNGFINNDMPNAVSRGSEDFYYYADRNDDTESAIVTIGETWTGETVFFRNNLATNRGYEHLHPSEWDTIGNGALTWTDENYRNGSDSHPHVGQVLAGWAIAVKTEWDFDEIFDYMDRWMDRTDYDAECIVKGLGDGCVSNERSANDFINDMWDEHRGNYEIKQIRSDVDQNSTINTSDAMLTLRNSLGLSMIGTAWQSSTTTGDVNCDGNSNSTDAMLILRYSLGLDMSGTDWCES